MTRSPIGSSSPLTEASMLPLCGFYAAAISRVLRHFSLPADVQVNECRAAGARKGCVLAVVLQRPASDRPATA